MSSIVREKESHACGSQPMLLDHHVIRAVLNIASESSHYSRLCALDKELGLITARTVERERDRKTETERERERERDREREKEKERERERERETERKRGKVCKGNPW